METAPVPSSASQVQTWVPGFETSSATDAGYPGNHYRITAFLQFGKFVHISLLSAYLGENHKASLTVNMPVFFKSSGSLQDLSP